MAFKLQNVNSQLRIARPGQPTAKMLKHERWMVLDVLGNPWGSTGHNVKELAAAERRVDERFTTRPSAQGDIDWLAANACPPEFEESTDSRVEV